MKYNVKRHAVVQPLDPSYRIIPLTKGMNTLVDAKNYDRFMERHWAVQKSSRGNTSYAVMSELLPNGKHRKVYMHREVMGNSAKYYDHINGDGLDNRECNLRPCEQVQNCMNRPKQYNKSTYKGVFLQNTNPFARIKIHGVDNYLGTYYTEEAAAVASDRAAIEAFGEFAQTNFPHSHYPDLFPTPTASL